MPPAKTSPCKAKGIPVTSETNEDLPPKMEQGTSSLKGELLNQIVVWLAEKNGGMDIGWATSNVVHNQQCTVVSWRKDLEVRSSWIEVLPLPVTT